VATEVSICNQALALLGEERILTLDDNTKTAGKCKDTYAPSRDAVLEEVNPQFARKTALLPAETAPPIGPYSLAFPLPPDCINVWWCGPSEDIYVQLEAWERVGDRIYAMPIGSQGQVFIWYTRRVEDAQQFTPTFADMLATRIAAELAYSITESGQRDQELWGKYERKRNIHSATDGQQGRTRRTFNRDLTGRRGSGAFGYGYDGYFVVGP
jgi:hypothetical protein